MMGTVHRVVGLLLALSLGVRAQTPVRVLAATIPNENDNTNTRGDLIVDDEPLMRDVEIIGFISKTGDILELDKTRSMGAIESRQEPEEGMTMCRYGNIVVYSDQDCNTAFLRPSNTAAAPVKTEEKEQQPDVEQTQSKPQKRRNRRKPSPTKRKNKKTQVRRKAPKKRGSNKNRRRSNLNQKQKSKRRKNLKTKNKQQNRRRANRKSGKRKRINYDETRSYA